jgi:predicted nucleic acid-binding protein
MVSRPRRIYWDTGVFICFLNHQEQERRKICEDILHNAKDGGVKLYTSLWTAVEVIRPKWIPHPQPLTDEQVHKIQAMFRWPWLLKVQVHEAVAFKAADLARIYGLKPADAIHAATAIMEEVDVLHAWDRDFSKVASLINIEAPSYVSQLPLIDVAMPIGPTPEAIAAAGGAHMVAASNEEPPRSAESAQTTGGSRQDNAESGFSAFVGPKDSIDVTDASPSPSASQPPVSPSPASGQA